MRRIKQTYIFIGAISFMLFSSSCNLLKIGSSSSEPATDLAAQKMIRDGKVFMQQKRYTQATVSFDQAERRRFHRGTTAAIYLSGLANYYAGNDNTARQKFEKLINEYDKSTYVPEAKYHLAVIHIESKDRRRQLMGFDLLTQVIDQKTNPTISKEAETALLKFLFEEVSIEFLEDYYYRIPANYQLFVVEALAYKKLEAGDEQNARRLYERYLNENNTTSPFLEELFNNSSDIVDLGNRSVYRIAVFLPLFLNNPTVNYEDDIPETTKNALNFYEGLELALQEYNINSDKKVYLKLFDTQRDTFQTKLFLEQLESFQPDVMVGALDMKVTNILSEWAEENQKPLIIPRLPFSEIVEGKSYSFLAHPSVKIHGAQLANQAYSMLNLKNILIWSDTNKFTLELADSFTEAFQQRGGFVQRAFVPIDKELRDKENLKDFDKEATADIRNMIKEYREELFDGWYFPFTDNASASSFILNELISWESYDIDLILLGSPQWYSKYDLINRENKEKTGLYFTTSYLAEETDQSYIEFYNTYLRQYYIPPAVPPFTDRLNFEGYDLGNYLIRLLEAYNFQSASLIDVMHTLPEQKGIHINYYFGNSQINQAVNIGQFTREGVRKVLYLPGNTSINNDIWADPNPRYGRPNNNSKN